MVIRAAALALAVLVAGCAEQASPPPKPARALPAHTGIERYFPLDHDTVFSYETYAENTGQRGVLVLRVRRPRADLAELDVAGRIQRIYVDKKGLALATGGHLLRAPLELGAAWVGDFGKVEITAVDRAVRVPAGSFKGCIETVERIQSGEIKKRTLTVFCPDVGIALRETEGQSGSEIALERLELKSYGPAFSYDPVP
jgi:hypothetical protein